MSWHARTESPAEETKSGDVLQEPIKCAPAADQHSVHTTRLQILPPCHTSENMCCAEVTAPTIHLSELATVGSQYLVI